MRRTLPLFALLALVGCSDDDDDDGIAPAPVSVT